ncbi:Methionine--tRNA ligase, cytoplasmic [Porphyridium purpureum]|uniref:Methionine--tRNA ligase, cytoplasmic n=1 Tax=Porphyridium purpureum TaxID=35688 RepID=A0A5J4YKA1_PORPP|nr:Methionine--tRNA ligase, cytoplasmic [Porphyridium purpureum]|eukprot:POR4788..scf244_11
MATKSLASFLGAQVRLAIDCFGTGGPGVDGAARAFPTSAQNEPQKKWIARACELPAQALFEAVDTALADTEALVLDEGIDKPGLADAVVYGALYPLMKAVPSSEKRAQYPDVWRWFAFVTSFMPADFDAAPRFDFDRLVAEVDALQVLDKKPAPSEQNGTIRSLPVSEPNASSASNPEHGGGSGSARHSAPADPADDEAKREAARLKKEAKKAAKAAEKEAKKAAEPAAESKKDEGTQPWRVDIRVGEIIKAEKHPDAEKLYVEQILVGDDSGEPRTICSGLVPYIPDPKDLLGLCCVVCNLKPANMVGIKSDGMVLAATSPDGTVVRLVKPPAGSMVGERIRYEDVEMGEGDGPDSVLAPKKKIFEKVSADFRTSESGEALWCDKAWLTSAGRCVAEGISGGSIR